MKKRIAALIMTVLLCAAIIPTTASASWSDSLKSTVFLLNADNDGNLVMVGGMIVSITPSKTYVLSDISSINGTSSYAQLPAIIYTLDFSYDDLTDEVGAWAELEWIDPELGIVLFSTPTVSAVKGHLSVPLARSDQLYEGLSVNYLGVYIESTEDIDGDIHYVDSYVYAPDMGRGFFIPKHYPSDPSRFLYIGGPVVTDNGVAIGMALSALDENGNHVVASLDPVIDWFIMNNLSYTPGFVNTAPSEPPVTEPPVTEPPVTEPPVTEPPVTEPPVTEPPVTEPPVTQPPANPGPTDDEEGGVSTPLLIGLIAVGVLLVAVAVILILRRNKSRAVKSSTATEGTAPTGSPTYQTRNDVTLSPLTVTQNDVTQSLQQPPVQPPVEEPATSEPVPEYTVPTVPAGEARTVPISSPGEARTVSINSAFGGYVLRGQGGILDGAVFPLMGNTVTIGRKPDFCAVIYPDGTPGISGIHCRLELINGYFYLTDLGSSNGTFLNGQRLAPNMPARLIPGSAFYLGGPVNTFIFEEAKQ